MMTWVARSVFRPLLHRIGEQEPYNTILLDRVRYWWAVCGDMCQALQDNENTADIPPCPLCFPCGLDPALATRPPEFHEELPARGAPDIVANENNRSNN